MGQEIERKFRVRLALWTPQGEGLHFRQGYLSTDKRRVVRVRMEGERGRLTIKGPTVGLSRSEFEYDIPAADALALLEQLCEQPIIDKHRHVEWHHGKRWEIDVFHGDNAGLVVAELELASEAETFTPPDWLGEEVSHDPRYFNAALQQHPFKDWAPRA